jgi:Protein of unknown function (DUF2924)
MIAAEPTRDAAPGAGLACADDEARSSSAPFLQSRLDRLQESDGSALREEWRRLFRSEPPRLSRDLLMRALAYRLQELELGGLPKWARQSLAGSAAAADPAKAGGASTPKPALPRLKPGTRLVREWHGRTHSVIVLDGAFEFEGQRYGSLTKIAREITGAHWSGPRFFGLVKRRVGAELEAAPAYQDDPEGAGGLAPPEQTAPSIETWQDMAVADGGYRAEQRTAESAHG